MATSDEKFAADSGVAHPMHDMIRSGAARLFYGNSTQKEYMSPQRVEILDARSEGHKGDQLQVESVRVRIRNEGDGSRSSVRTDGEVVLR